MSTVNPRLSPRQAAILEFIEQKIKTDGYPPSVREIIDAVGLKSTSTAHAHLLKLEEKGYIKRDPAKGRAIIPLNMGAAEEEEKYAVPTPLPLIGKVAAGVPITAEENVELYMPVAQELLGNGTHFLLSVQGDSMIETGIFDGDYLIVKEQQYANNGEIVVAMIDGEATVKRFYRRSDSVELRPENSSMQSIIVTEVSILGKAVGLLRKL